MDCERFGDRELLHRFFQNALAFLGRQNGMMGVVELFDVTTFVVVADEAFENDEGATSGVCHYRAERGEVDIVILDGEHGGGFSLRRREA